MKNLDDLLILGGAGLVICATFMLSVVAGIYLTGAAMILVGALLARLPPGRGGR